MRNKIYIIISLVVILIASFAIPANAQSLPTVTMDKPVQDMTIPELQTKIAEILQVIQQLQALIAQLQPGSASCNFYRNLYPGTSGSDVKCLQQYLNNTGHTVASSGPGSSNKETIYYGSLTRTAVKKWQDANHIEQGAWWGYFGPKSQAIYNELAGTGEQSPYVPPENGTSEDKAGTYCGDNIAQRPSDQGTIEDCDGTDLRSKTCFTQGYPGGTLLCSNDCSFNISQCTGAGPEEPTLSTPGPSTSCGDNIIQSPNTNGVNEVCDGTKLNNQTCITKGYTGGTLLCLSNCLTFNTTNCTSDTPPVNNAPILNTIGNKSIDENEELSFTILATDADNDTLNYSIQNRPTGASFNTTTKTFTWTPTYEQQGTYTPTFIVSDLEYTDQEIITITVIDICVPDTCLTLGYECETWDDGCGGTLDCGTCSSGYICESGLCVQETPEPYCGDSICNGIETCSTCPQDCGICPEESAYYVRPAGGSYGLEDGSSYEDAWDGLLNVVWGGAGVVAGDNLYVCGTHINTYKSGDLVSDYYFTPGATGTESDPITIRGCPGDPAIIWNAYIDGRNTGIVPGNWTGPVDGVYYNETGTYAKIFTGSGIYENINGASYDRYTELDSAQEVTDYNGVGVYYKEAFGTNQHKIWLKPFEPSTFKENIRFSGYGGYFLQLGDGKNYIEYQDIDFIGGTILDTGTYSNYTFTRCTFKANSSAQYIYAPTNASYITFDDCEFSNGVNGIYVLWNSNTHHLYIQNSYFHDIGTQWGDGDAHAIGIQDNEYFWITGNRIENSGSGIIFDVGATTTQRHVYIQGNYVSNMLTAYGKASSGDGITLGGDNANPKGNTSDMIVSNNIVVNCDNQGISTSRKDFVDIYNNVVYSCSGNYTIVGNSSDGASVRFYNNISLFPKLHVNQWTGKIYGKNHIYFNQNYADITYDFEADNNIYYPDADVDGSFYFLSGDVVLSGATFTQWKAANLAEGDVVDPNSIVVDPLFVSSDPQEPADFKLLAGSPSIDAGIDVGLTLDYEGNPIVGVPDIGPYEYQGASPARISQTDEKLDNVASVLSAIRTGVQDVLEKIKSLF